MINLLDELLELAGCEPINESVEFLTEGNVNGLKQQFPKIPEEIWAKILEIDPQSNGEQCGKISRWVAQVISNHIREVGNDPKQVANTINVVKWDNLKGLFKALITVPNGITQLPTIHSFAELKPLVLDLMLKQQEKEEGTKEANIIKETLSLGSQIIYKSDRYIAFIPWTLKSSKVLRGGEGNDTVCVWCTAWDNSNNMWAHYMERGMPLKVIYDKQDNKFYQYCDTKMGEWAGFRDQHNNKLDITSVLTDDALVSLILDDDKSPENIEKYGKMAQETLEKFDNLSEKEEQVLNRYVSRANGNEEEGDDPKILALADELNIAYADAEDLVNDNDYLVLTEDEANERAENLAYEEVEECYNMWSHGETLSGWWESFFENNVVDCINNLEDVVYNEVEYHWSESADDYEIIDYVLGIADDSELEKLFGDKIPELKQLAEDNDVELESDDLSYMLNELLNYIDLNDLDKHYELAEWATKNEYNSIDDYVDYLSNIFGDNFIRELGLDVDIDKLTTEFLDHTDRGEIIATYDGVELENNSQDETYYIYRI